LPCSTTDFDSFLFEKQSHSLIHRVWASQWPLSSSAPGPGTPFAADLLICPTRGGVTQQFPHMSCNLTVKLVMELLQDASGLPYA